MSYQSEQKERRQAMKIKNNEQYLKYKAEYDEIVGHGDFERIRDLGVVMGEWEKELKRIEKEKLDNPTTEMFANHHGWSDIEPYEIIDVRTKNKIMVRAMDAERDPDWKPEIIAGGFSGHCVNQHTQRYTYKSNEDREIVAVRRHKDGRWYDKSGRKFIVSLRPIKFYDFNF